ncbi:uncharacterized protein A1O9_11833 [Exophiala aquamarina CBS 119918]|uniref:Uncharacterized protein n=1 Tax=Exophiala aquamarina CBS 119918 TaxID=1182545 RepID=A0A072NX96_9EURO|nr:uncharacterized protein A1O9_11833 [Exophiala aquamarina CBS 119918]KEF52206.1 hypothetical protein A1O9_11833 [Exophiala aquamarina CBS 119918]
MPSQPLSTFSSSLPSSLCLPLTKFSYATVSNENIVPIPWIHLSSKNSLFALFDTSPTLLDNGQVEDRQKLKVLRDPEIMEEIDLYVLAKEAHRSMNTAPTSLLDAQVPQVTIIVKVPNIAIKYPMPNGQIRRFQMRFATNEHYYDAMKSLSRADVPTVEAGSFPATKQPPAQNQPSNILPDDSASQIGVPNTKCGTRSYANRAPLASEMNPGPHPPLISTLSSAPTVHNMPPPNFRSNDHSVGQLPTIQNTRNPISGNHSNLSSTTGTTLVPTISALSYRADGTLGYIGMMPHSGTNHAVSGQTGTDRYDIPRPSTTHSADQKASLLLPPRRELPFPTQKPSSAVKPPNEVTTTATGMTEPRSNSSRDWAIENPGMSGGPDQDLTPSIPAAKSKRAAAKTATKTPAKKPRVAPTRKKPAAKKPAKNNTTISSIDEHLQRPELGRMTRSRSILTAQTSNQTMNQQSKDPVGDSRSASIPAQASRVRDRNKHDVDFANRKLVVQDLEIQGTPKDVGHAFPCTPADQIIQTHTPRPAAVAADPVSPSKQVHRHEEQAQTIPARSFSIDHQSTPDRAPTVVHTSDAEKNELAHGSPFANSDASLRAWATLPPEIRNPALRDFVCQSIMQPSFVDLCKALENVWETTLLEPRLRNRNT